MTRTILFQGDSVTDVDRGDASTNFLGKGYPAIAAKQLAREGSCDVFLNRAMAGDRAVDLLRRWQEDCLDIRPDILSLLLGVNDAWWKDDGVRMGTPVEKFEKQYDSLLSQVIEQKNDTIIIIMEPFLLPFPDDRMAWRATLDPIVHAIRRLAKKYRAKYVPLDGLFAAAAIERGYEAVCADGVHPTPFGQELIAKEWLRAFRELNE